MSNLYFLRYTGSLGLIKPSDPGPGMMTNAWPSDDRPGGKVTPGKPTEVVVTPKPVEKQTNAWPSDDTPVALPPEQKRPAPKPIDIVVITPNPGPIAQTQAWPSDDGLGKTQPKTPAIRIDLVVVAPNPGVMTNAWPSDQEAGRTPGLHPQIIAEPTTAQRIIGS